MESVKLGALFKNASIFGTAQLISPAANVNGVIIRTGAFSANSSGIVTTGNVAPTGVGDISKPILAATGPAALTLPYPITLPAGYGLWISTNNNGNAYITYDLL
ncbi:hypothetical protein P7C00_11585 [Pseudomonas sp. JDS08PS003]|uniref:hypothetical protein n=1 Tax=Pseudomonas sp. JDS08PS003 TaxID=2497162 RepID=UPI003857D95E